MGGIIIGGGGYGAPPRGGIPAPMGGGGGEKAPLGSTGPCPAGGCGIVIGFLGS